MAKLIGAGALKAHIDRLRAAEAEADKRVTPEQRAIRGDNRFVVLYLPWLRVYVFGQLYGTLSVTTREEQLGASPDEVAEARIGTVRAYRRGYRYGQWYSSLNVEGETGMYHIARLVEISQTEFNMAAMRRWSCPTGCLEVPRARAREVAFEQTDLDLAFLSIAVDETTVALIDGDILRSSP